MKYDYENWVGQVVHGAKIYAADLLCTTEDVYSIPTSNSLHEDISNLEKRLKKLDRSGFTLNEEELKDKEDRIKEEISTYKELLTDETIFKFEKILRVYEKKLSRIHRIWYSGYHKTRNPIQYYLDWALEKNIEIEWHDWARQNSLLPSTSALNEEKKMHDPRYQNTWKSLAKVLCLGLDLPLEKPYKAAGMIAQIAASKGVDAPGSEETIANRIKEIKEM